MAKQLASLDNPHDVGLPPSKISKGYQYAGVALFAIGVVASGILSLTEHWRKATFVLGAALLWLSVLRLTCDSRVLGVLAVRSRTFDAIFTAILGGSMIFLAASIDSLGS